ncbi:CAP domain-containing protein [Candidatus Nomurabacteria bacterium]|nr:CAP domain-containing protein [Candidatus Nomurabacteria bacterium]
MRTFLIFTFIIGLLFPFKIFASEANPLVSVTPSALVILTNEERAKNNLTPLLYSDLLQKAAQMKADDMAARGYFSHTTPDGEAPWYFFNRAGYQYRHAGENLAVNFFDSKEVAEAWMNSPTHRANVLKKNFTQIGIGVASGVFEGKNTVFVAEFFGTPLLQAKIDSTEKTKQPKAGVTAKIATEPAKVLGEAITATTETVADPLLLQIKAFLMYNGFMQKARILLFLGIWIVVLPYLGFPNSWKDILTILSGVGLIFMSTMLYREHKSNGKTEEKTFDNFRENNFIAGGETQAENPSEIK